MFTVIINSLKDLGAAMKAKNPEFKCKTPRGKREKACKCEVCGGLMRHVSGTNIWVCDLHKLEVKKFKDKEGIEHEAQVFSKCGNVVIGQV